jgi:hypothetical protein
MLKAVFLFVLFSFAGSISDFSVFFFFFFFFFFFCFFFFFEKSWKRLVIADSVL